MHLSLISPNDNVPLAQSSYQMSWQPSSIMHFSAPHQVDAVLAAAHTRIVTQMSDRCVPNTNVRPCQPHNTNLGQPTEEQ